LLALKAISALRFEQAWELAWTVRLQLLLFSRCKGFVCSLFLGSCCDLQHVQGTQEPTDFAVADVVNKSGRLFLEVVVLQMFYLLPSRQRTVRQVKPQFLPRGVLALFLPIEILLMNHLFLLRLLRLIVFHTELPHHKGENVGSFLETLRFILYWLLATGYWLLLPRTSLQIK